MLYLTDLLTPCTGNRMSNITALHRRRTPTVSYFNMLLGCPFLSQSIRDRSDGRMVVFSVIERRTATAAAAATLPWRLTGCRNHATSERRFVPSTRRKGRRGTGGGRLWGVPVPNTSWPVDSTSRAINRLLIDCRARDCAAREIRVT